jgi:hypothetical protein
VLNGFELSCSGEQRNSYYYNFYDLSAVSSSRACSSKLQVVPGYTPVTSVELAKRAQAELKLGGIDNWQSFVHVSELHDPDCLDHVHMERGLAALSLPDLLASGFDIHRMQQTVVQERRHQTRAMPYISLSIM